MALKLAVGAMYYLYIQYSVYMYNCLLSRGKISLHVCQGGNLHVHESEALYDYIVHVRYRIEGNISDFDRWLVYC